jgi:hypothetical protein
VNRHVIGQDGNALLSSLVLRRRKAVRAAAAETVEDGLERVQRALAGACREDVLGANALGEEERTLLGEKRDGLRRQTRAP